MESFNACTQEAKEAEKELRALDKKINFEFAHHATGAVTTIRHEYFISGMFP